MAKNTGKVREKSGNFVSPEKWEPCHVSILYCTVTGQIDGQEVTAKTILPVRVYNRGPRRSPPPYRRGPPPRWRPSPPRYRRRYVLTFQEKHFIAIKQRMHSTRMRTVCYSGRLGGVSAQGVYTPPPRIDTRKNGNKCSSGKYNLK